MIFKGNKLALLKVLKIYNLSFVALRNLHIEHRIRKAA